MKYSIVYTSKTGNTALLAEKIKEKLSPDSLHYFGQPSAEGAEADTIFVGFWTDKGTCVDDLKDFIQSLNNKEVVLFGTAGFGGSQAYFNQILDRVSKLIPDSCTLKGSFMCQGEMPPIVRERYVQTLEKNPSNAKMKSLIENFDKAIGHPNNDDFADLNNFLNSILV